MNEELSLRQLFKELILFFINFKTVIVSITLIGLFVGFLYTNFEEKSYELSAIATSGISEFERIPVDRGIYLNQRTAINLINQLNTDIYNNDLSLLAKKLNIEKDLLVDLKKIEAIEIMREEQLDKKRKIATQKFEIKIYTTSNKIITSIEDGLLYYFNNLTYVNDCYNLYKISIQKEINEINNEVQQLRQIRSVENLSFDNSSINLYSRKKPNESSNEIIDLIQLRTLKETNLALLKPLNFVQSFSLPQKETKRDIPLFLLIVTIISFIFSVIVSIFMNVSKNI
tara:strand:- start:67 stop:921 length:855 start_codon:yes stop_codon:yes gene_type:complete